MTILVTGATGTVGRQVVQHLLQRGATVRAGSDAILVEVWCDICKETNTGPALSCKFGSP